MSETADQYLRLFELWGLPGAFQFGVTPLILADYKVVLGATFVCGYLFIYVCVVTPLIGSYFHCLYYCMYTNNKALSIFFYCVQVVLHIYTCMYLHM